MNVIALSLYGTLPRYLTGAVRNAEMARRFYPGWQVMVWVGSDVPIDTRRDLKAQGALLVSPPPGIANGMLWRFLVHDRPGVERYIVRDVDSRFSQRETDAVGEWIRASTTLHVMRDHPYHSQAMMGGMWGWKKQEKEFLMEELLALWKDFKPRYGADQEFLRRFIWSRPVTRTVNDSCGAFDHTKNWPITGPNFVGEYVDEHEYCNQAHQAMRLKHR